MHTHIYTYCSLLAQGYHQQLISFRAKRMRYNLAKSNLIHRDAQPLSAKTAVPFVSSLVSRCLPS